MVLPPVSQSKGGISWGGRVTAYPALATTPWDFLHTFVILRYGWNPKCPLKSSCIEGLFPGCCVVWQFRQRGCCEPIQDQGTCRTSGRTVNIYRKPQKQKQGCLKVQSLSRNEGSAYPSTVKVQVQGNSSQSGHAWESYEYHVSAIRTMMDANHFLLTW